MLFSGSVEDTTFDITAPKSGGNAANYGKRFPTQNNRILSLWNDLCKHCGLTIKWTRGAISLPNAPISVLDWICFEMVKKDPTKPLQGMRAKKELNLIHQKITAACHIVKFVLF